MKIDVKHIMAKLKSNENPFFVSERHFQVAFALMLKEEYKNLTIIPEFVFEKNWHIDLVAFDNKTKEMAAFEFKYVLDGGYININGKKYEFSNHYAADVRRAQYLYDIHRIETVLEKDKRFKTGYAIILTNMSVIYDKGTNKNSIDNDFDISNKHQQIKSGVHKFKQSKRKYNPDNVKLNNSYPIQWEDYAKNETSKLFRYLSIKIN